jgi:hypothetical protein
VARAHFKPEAAGQRRVQGAAVNVQANLLISKNKILHPMWFMK